MSTRGLLKSLTLHTKGRRGRATGFFNDWLKQTQQNDNWWVAYWRHSKVLWTITSAYWVSSFFILYPYTKYISRYYTPFFLIVFSFINIQISIKMLEQWRQSVVIMFISLVADKMVSSVWNLKPLRPEMVSWYTRIQSGKGRCPWTSACCSILHYTSPPPSFVHRDNNSIWAEGIWGMSRGDPITFPTTTLATYGRSLVAWQQV